MLRALVSVNSDIASVIALNYACQLSGVVPMGIQPICVKEPESGDEAPGTGWVRRTWEQGLINREREAVHRLIEDEKVVSGVLAKPQFLLGNRDDQILANLLGGAYDLFVEGCVSCYERSELSQRLNSKLYRHLPCPVIIARNLIQLRKILVVLNDEVNVGKLLPTLIKLFKGADVRLDLMYCRFLEHKSPAEPIDTDLPLYQEVDEILEARGWTPGNRLALQGSVQSLARQIEEYSLVATSSFLQPGQDGSALLELLGATPAPILLC
ncbi:MAG: hypothetical protein PVH87_22250 [Desulfobacteraceae bacterium]|jgi:hypothetical protein